ncbi:S-layer homology domain-containing protein [Propionispora sp. 2/2-37]|uniref:S-layer homology domain-containing protein n=1 Tax=Propionispora sp. 2/2-37 TaxID=1677858 RepID=UPI0006BB8170|nr:S-layer homology domain-containing protein [Propionispora sp. 2/2-37]
MKKKLAVTLALTVALGVGGTALAANPFVDVPAKHWSYDAVSKLAADGIIDGYGDGTFKGDKTITRYEMATIVAKAMAKEDKADAQQKALIEKLAAEYSEELDNLGVRVSKLEKKAAADSINFKGEARLRFKTFDFDDPAKENKTSNVLRTRLYATGKINDEWTYTGRLASENDLRNGSDGKEEKSLSMDNVYVQGPLFNGTVTFGRFDYKPNYAMLIDSTLNGVNFAFGDKLKTNLFYGKDNNNKLFGRSESLEKLEMYGVTSSYALSPNSNINAGYYNFKSNHDEAVFATGTDDSGKLWEVGFDTKLVDNLVLTAAYGSSNADDEDKAYFAQLDYKKADKKKAGSFGAWVNYRHFEANVAPKTTFDGAYANDSQAKGGKGYEIGFGYVPVANTLWKTKYVDLKPTVDGSDYKTKFFQTQVEFFF